MGVLSSLLYEQNSVRRFSVGRDVIDAVINDGVDDDLDDDGLDGVADALSGVSM